MPGSENCTAALAKGLFALAAGAHDRDLLAPVGLHVKLVLALARHVEQPALQRLGPAPWQNGRAASLFADLAAFFANGLQGSDAGAPPFLPFPLAAVEAAARFVGLLAGLLQLDEVVLVFLEADVNVDAVLGVVPLVLPVPVQAVLGPDDVESVARDWHQTKEAQGPRRPVRQVRVAVQVVVEPARGLALDDERPDDRQRQQEGVHLVVDAQRGVAVDLLVDAVQPDAPGDAQRHDVQQQPLPEDPVPANEDDAHAATTGTRGLKASTETVGRRGQHS